MGKYFINYNIILWATLSVRFWTKNYWFSLLISKKILHLAFPVRYNLTFSQERLN